MSNNESKTRLIDYLMESSKEKDSRETLGEVLLVVSSCEQCYLTTKERVTEIAELTSTHEETDTRMMIHVKHAASKYSKVVVVSEDTDVFVVLFGLHSDITGAN